MSLKAKFWVVVLLWISVTGVCLGGWLHRDMGYVEAGDLLALLSGTMGLGAIVGMMVYIDHMESNRGE